MFHASVKAEEPSAVAVKSILEGSGLHLVHGGGRKWAPNQVRCTGAFWQAYLGMGEASFQGMVKLLTCSYRTEEEHVDPEALTGLFVRAMTAAVENWSLRHMTRARALLVAGAGAGELLGRAKSMYGGLDGWSKYQFVASQITREAEPLRGVRVTRQA